MLLFVLGLVWFGVVMAVVSLAAYRYWARPAAYMDRAGGGVIEPAAGLLPHEETTLWIDRLARNIGEKMPASPASSRTLRKRLVAAGFRSPSAVAAMRGIAAMTSAAAGLVVLLVWNLTRPFGTDWALLTALLFALGGYFLPNEVLLFLVRRRRGILRHSLPDAIDLMVICVEAGLGLDQTLVDVSNELALSHPELSEEIALVTLELRAGSRRAEALRNLADRTGEPEFRNLVGILIQADRFGTSIADALRSHSEFMRVKRRQTAEEKANKVGVKLVFPIFFFILPSMFLVTVGPALLQLLFEFFPQMRSFQ